MKIAGARVESLLGRPDPALSAVLLYGPDEGLVRERALRVVRAVLPDPRDPFGLTELAADAVRADPALLADEARALCFGGGRRVVRLRQASDQLSAACRAVLDLPSVAALVVVDAGELGKASSLRRLFEAAPNAAAIACWREEGRALAGTLREQLGALGLRPDAEAEAWLAQHLGADRGITASELAKLDLYLGPAAAGRGPRPVTLQDVAAVIGDSAALGFDDLVHAAALGRAAEVERGMSRLLAEGQSPVSLLRALANHFGRLYQLACLVEAGEPAERVIETARPPIHLRRRGSFQVELRRWSAAMLAAQAGRLLEAEIGCKTTGRPAAELCRAAALAACLAPA
ncbi:MAG TPA: DNA polymerase III subunit delta [Geminicoccaceae bacterium]|nr:DNA polymerase III subunit delta [Geminicoccaceae bacterium]